MKLERCPNCGTILRVQIETPVAFYLKRRADGRLICGPLAQSPGRIRRTARRTNDGDDGSIYTPEVVDPEDNGAGGYAYCINGNSCGFEGEILLEGQGLVAND